MVNATTNQVITPDMLKDLAEKLKPKKVVFTNDMNVYNALLQLPYMNEDCVKFSEWVQGTLIVDMEKMNKIALKPYIPTMV